MGLFEKVTDLKNTFEGKLLAVAMAVILIFSMTQIAAFAGSDPEKQNAEKAEDLLTGTETSTGIAPELGEALISFDTTSSYVMVRNQVLVSNQAKVEGNKAFGFNAFPDTGFEVSSVTAINKATGKPVLLTNNAGTYTVAATDVTSNLVIKVVSTQIAVQDDTASNSADEESTPSEAKPFTEDGTEESNVDDIVNVDTIEPEVEDSEELANTEEESEDITSSDPASNFMRSFLALFGPMVEGSDEEEAETNIVTFFVEGEVVAEEKVPTGTLVTMPDVSKYEQNIFGWYYEGTTDLFYQWMPITEDIALEAAIGNSHIVTYLDYDGSEIVLIEVEDGTLPEDLLPQEPSVPVGQSFTHWVDQSTNAPLEGPITQDITLIPTYNDLVLAVFVTEGPIVESQVISSDTGNKITKPAASSMVRSGYTFNYWTTNPASTSSADQFNFDMPVYETTYLYAVWTPKKVGYVINYLVEQAGLGLGSPAQDPALYDLLYSRTIEATAANASILGTAGQKLSVGTGGIISDKLITDRTYKGGGDAVYDVLDYCNYLWTDADDDGKELSGAGDTVINVYCERIVYEYIFNLNTASTASSAPVKIAINDVSADSEYLATHTKYVGSGQGTNEDGKTTYAGGEYTIFAKLGDNIGSIWPNRVELLGSTIRYFSNWNSYHGLAPDNGTVLANKGYIRYAQKQTAATPYRLTETKGTLTAQLISSACHETRFYFTELSQTEKDDPTITSQAVLSDDKDFLNNPLNYKIVKHNDDYYRFNRDSNPGSFQNGWNPRGWPGAIISGYQQIQMNTSATGLKTTDYQSVTSSTKLGSISKTTNPALFNGYYGDTDILQGNICYFMPRAMPTLTLQVGEGATISDATSPEYGFTPGAANTYKKQVKYEEALNLPSEPTRADGATFEGWYLDDTYTTKFNPENITGMPATDLMLYAKFDEATITVKYYSDFTSNSASLVATAKYAKGEKLSVSDLDSNPIFAGIKEGDIVPGYGEFEAWYFKASSTSSTYTKAPWGMPLSASEYDLHASFKPIQYNVTFRAPNVATQIGDNAEYVEVSGSPILVPAGSNNTLAKQRYSENQITGMAPKFANYVFDGWFTVDGDYEYTDQFKTYTAVTDNVIVYAKYTPTYQVVGKYDEGISADSGTNYAQTVILDRSSAAMTFNVKTGYEITDVTVEGIDYTPEWSVEDRTYVFPIQSGVSTDITVTVTTRLSDYAVTYQYVGALVPEGANDLLPPQAIQHMGDAITIESNPTLVGYTFSGWTVQTSGVSVTDGEFTMPASDVVIVGSWVEDYAQTKEVSYTVEYYLNGNLDAAKSKVVTDDIWINDFTNLLAVDVSGINTTDAFGAGYVFAYTNPATIPTMIVSGGVIKVYYIDEPVDPILVAYVVRYLDENTNEPVADAKLVTGEKLGATVTEEAIGVDGYTLVSERQKSEILTRGGLEIEFFYTTYLAVLPTPFDGAVTALADFAGTAMGDQETPLGAATNCWVHFYMVMGMLITAIYSVGVLVRRRMFLNSLNRFEDTVLGGAFDINEGYAGGNARPNLDGKAPAKG